MIIAIYAKDTGISNTITEIRTCLGTQEENGVTNFPRVEMIEFIERKATYVWYVRIP